MSWEVSATWKPDAGVAFASEVDVRFFPDGDGDTRVDLEHHNFERMGFAEGDAMRKGVDNGWPGLLNLYIAAVANGT